MRIILSVAGVLIIATVAFLGGAAWKSNQTLPPSPNMDLVNQVNLMQLRRACAEQAGKNFKETEQHKTNTIEAFTAHYNTGLKKCFVLYSTSTIDPHAMQSTEFLYLEDAFERVEYGSYDAIARWGPGQNKQSRIVMCERMPNGASRPACKSLREWNVFVEQYMESAQPNE